jgi:hypothetical protein
MTHQIDFKSLRITIKDNLDRDTVKGLLEAIGVGIRRDYRFNENNSFSIDKNGTIKDFGSTDFSGDFVSFLIDVLGVSPSEAMEWTAKSLGVWHE